MAHVQEPLWVLLEAFRARANTMPAVQRLVKGWSRVIEIRVLGDAPRAFFLRCHAQQFDAPLEAWPERADIVVSATAQVLLEVLSGDLNPTRAHVEGELHYTGSEKDELIVDAILMLIWGY